MKDKVITLKIDEQTEYALNNITKYYESRKINLSKSEIIRMSIKTFHDHYVKRTNN